LNFRNVKTEDTHTREVDIPPEVFTLDQSF